METYQGIPTYYINLIKKGQQEIEKITIRINELSRSSNTEAVKGEIADLVEQKMAIREKLESYVKCHCNACKM